MVKSSLLRSTVLMATTLVALGYTYPAQAVGTLTIQQISPSATLSSWRLKTPTGQVSNRALERVLTVTAPSGSYNLVLTVPPGATVEAKFYLEDNLVKTVTEATIPFDFNGQGNLKIDLIYHYSDVITVNSTPSGAAFEIKGPLGKRLTGITPATFSNLPPAYYSVNATPPSGCTPVAPQARNLEPGQTLQFHLRFVCKNNPPTTTPPPPPPTTSAIITPTANVQLFQSLNQAETVPGSRLTVTVGVRNIGVTTLRNLAITQHFNPQQLSLPVNLPQAGRLSGRTANWHIAALKAGASWSATFPVTVSDTVTSGERINLASNLAGPDLKAARGQLLSKTTTVAVAPLPQAGANQLASLFLALSALSGLLFVLPIKRPKLAVVPKASQ